MQDTRWKGEGGRRWRRVEKNILKSILCFYSHYFSSPEGCAPSQSETRGGKEDGEEPEEGKFSKECDNKTLSRGFLN